MAITLLTDDVPVCQQC